jgi:type 1 glutamine amidotransferase
VSGLLTLFALATVAAGQEAQRLAIPVVPKEVPEDRQRTIEAAAPDRPTVPPRKPRRVLIWNTPFMDQCPHAGWCVPFATYAMEVLGVKTGAFEPAVSDDVAMFLPENLAQFDAIVMNNSNGEWIRPTEADMERLKGHGATVDEVEQLLRKSFMDWVEAGGGIMAYHHSIAGNTHWPEFTELLGASYWGHPWNEEVGVKVDEPDHPLAAAFKGQGFRIAEEIFQFNEPYSREKLRVLLSLDVAKTNMGVQWVYRTDNDFGLAWVKCHGKGRVFYTAFGHRTELYWNPTILRFYLDGIQFATGDLDAPCEPR